MAQRRTETEAYVRASALAREVRVRIASQIAELIREGDQMGSGEKVQMRLEGVVAQRRRILEARGRQRQHYELGLPVAGAVTDELEAREGLRSAVMLLGVSAAEWVADMDFQQRKRELTLTNGNARARRADEDTI